MKKAMSPRLMMILSMAIFGTLGLFVRNIPVSSGELALYRAVLAAEALWRLGHLLCRANFRYSGADCQCHCLCAGHPEAAGFPGPRSKAGNPCRNKALIRNPPVQPGDTFSGGRP